LVSKFRVSDRDIAVKATKRLAPAETVHLADAFLDQLVHRDIDAADEETRDAGDLPWITALRHEMLQARQIGLNNLLVDLLRKQQRDVDINALTEELTDRRQPRLRARHLDHQVIATNRLP
jgi:hypothetical protein